MDLQPLAALDSFPYRHRVADVMAAPAVTVSPETPLAEAMRLMLERRVSSVITVDDAQRPAGILTERDILRALDADSAASLRRPVGSATSSPVHSVMAEAFVYVALARMDRLGIRHLAVTDAAGRLIGAVSARALLKLRANQALAIGDGIAVANDAAAIGAAVKSLPDLAQALRADGVTPLAIAAVISGVMRDATARATALAEIALRGDGRGPAPAPYAMLVLGSGGRGESLLAPDQDNALIHDGQASDDTWFSNLGSHASDTLNDAGIPYCKGKVMASVTLWRQTRQGWDAQIETWLRQSNPQDLLNVDIFYDFRGVHGDLSLAQALRRSAQHKARHARPFLKLLAVHLDELHAPLGLFGGIRTEDGRVDLKRGGMLPLVSGARLMALAHGIGATGTVDRLHAAAEAGALGHTDAENLQEAYEILLGAVLDQQLADIAEGIPPSSKVATARLERREKHDLREALGVIEGLKLAVRDVLTANA